MKKWRLFGKSKNDDIEVNEPIKSEIEPEKEDLPLAEHKETLYSKDSKPKKEVSSKKIEKTHSNQRVWIYVS